MNTLIVLLVGQLIHVSPGKIDTFVGTGKKGFSGDGKQATKAQLNQPFHCALDQAGNLYVAEALNHCIRKVNLKTGIITTVAGTGKKGYSGDGGPANEAMLREPNDCHLDGKGGLLIADVSDWRVRRVDLKTGLISTFAGIGRQRGKINRQQLGDGGPAEKAIIYEARAVCIDNFGNTFICERRGNAIRRVDTKGVITTIAGTGAKGDRDGNGRQATFNGPKAIRCDDLGNIYVVDTENHSVRRIAHKTWQVTTVAGGQKGGHGDGGDALKAGMDRPHGCVIDSQGNLYIADSNNHRVRRVQLRKP